MLIPNHIVNMDYYKAIQIIMALMDFIDPHLLVP